MVSGAATSCGLSMVSGAVPSWARVAVKNAAASTMMAPKIATVLQALLMPFLLGFWFAPFPEWARFYVEAWLGGSLPCAVTLSVQTPTNLRHRMANPAPPRCPEVPEGSGRVRMQLVERQG